MSLHSRIRVAVFQQRVPGYRNGVFERLALESDIELSVFAETFGRELLGVRCTRVRGVGVGPFRIHPSMLTAAFRRGHDVILCEGRLGLATSAIFTLLQRRWLLPVVWWTSLWRRNAPVGTGTGVRGLLVRAMMLRAASVATYSRTAADAAMAAGVPARMVFVAPNALDTTWLRAIEAKWLKEPAMIRKCLSSAGIRADHIALFIGRLIAGKGLEQLVAAWAEVVRRRGHTQATLVIIGDGPERGRLVDWIRAHNLEGNVRLLGEIRDDEAVCPYILSSRVLVLPGAGGLAVNQALTHGLPVVAAGGDGTERDVVIDGTNGYLVPAGDVSALACRLSELLLLPQDEWMCWSSAARNSVNDRANIDLMIGGLAGAIRSAYDVGHSWSAPTMRATA